MQCENASRLGHYPVVSPQCYDGAATRIVTIQYNEVEKDTLLLCNNCAKAVAKDARRRGYKVTNRRKLT